MDAFISEVMMPKQDGHFSRSFNPAALKAAHEQHGNASGVLKIEGADFKDDGRAAGLLGHPPGYKPFDNSKPQVTATRKP